jgi:hypothetical protein
MEKAVRDVVEVRKTLDEFIVGFDLFEWWKRRGWEKQHQVESGQEVESSFRVENG